AAEFTDLEGRSWLGAFLARLDDAERFDVDLPVDVVVQADAVQLMTIHKAKGLEFEHVFIPAVAKGAFPGGRARGEWTT
ncbi:MAG: 3'-5' exonuclease, partial [Actinomycetales bacterium]